MFFKLIFYNLYPHLKRISDDFYVGKIKDKNLWLVMEQINAPKKRELWIKYIEVQTSSRVVDHATQLPGNDNKPIMPNFKPDGSSYFKKVLDEVNFRKNEVWVSYITTNQFPKPIDSIENSSIKDYTSNDVPLRSNYKPQAFPNNILMYVTVVTSPEALITSHMGVSLSIDGIYQRKDRTDLKGISMDLHSFAAKVMCMRNSKRKFMINAPALQMEAIIAQELPDGSFFAGLGK